VEATLQLITIVGPTSFRALPYIVAVSARENTPLVCPACRGVLACRSQSLVCTCCNLEFPVDNGIVDFSGGSYFDQFKPSESLRDWHEAALQAEYEGAVTRIRDYYLPRIRSGNKNAFRVLDCGCGNGLSVDLLSEAGFEAWGNDLSQLRKWQWRERSFRTRLVVANGMALPFPSGYFDIVLSSGVIEHIGVTETLPPTYSATPLPDQRFQRLAFVGELMRVLSPAGSLFIDSPNGAFPFDFWHGNNPGSARRHKADEGFLPTHTELVQLLKESGASSVRALSPWRRLQFRQAASHIHGRLLRIPATLLFILMCTASFRWLAASRVNPFLVIEATRR